MHWLWGESGQGSACCTFFWEPRATHTVCTIFHKSVREEKYIFQLVLLLLYLQEDLISRALESGCWGNPTVWDMFSLSLPPSEQVSCYFFCVSLNLPWVHTLWKYLCDAHPTSVLPCVLAHESFSAATSTQMVAAPGLFAERGGVLHCSLQEKWLNCGYMVGKPSPVVLEWLLQGCWKDAVWYNPSGAHTEQRKSFVPELYSQQSVIICEPQRSALKCLLKK